MLITIWSIMAIKQLKLVANDTQLQLSERKRYQELTNQDDIFRF